MPYRIYTAYIATFLPACIPALDILDHHAGYYHGPVTPGSHQLAGAWEKWRAGSYSPWQGSFTPDSLTIMVVFDSFQALPATWYSE